MSARTRLQCAGFLQFGVVFALAVLRSSAETSQQPLHFSSPDGYAIVVPVLINGDGPYEFLFDTGSTDTVVDPYIVRILRLPTSGSTKRITITRSAPLKTAVVNELNVGSISTQQLRVVIDSLNALKKLEPNIHGILGQDVLGRMDYVIDNDHQLIEFNPNELMAGNIRWEITRIATMRKSEEEGAAGVIVPAQVSVAGTRTLRLLLDSGSAFPVLVDRKQTEVFSAAEQTDSVTDEDGHQSNLLPRLTSITIGQLSFQTETRIAHSNLGGLPIDGLLPTACFSKVYVGVSKGFAVFTAKRTRKDGPDPERSGTSVGQIDCRIGSNAETGRGTESSSTW